jgi:hypothetical protein
VVDAVERYADARRYGDDREYDDAADRALDGVLAALDRFQVQAERVGELRTPDAVDT